MIYIYKYKPVPPFVPASFNNDFNESYDMAETSSEPARKASFGLDFDRSFNGLRKPLTSQVVYIPKSNLPAENMYLILHNVSENTDDSIDVTDSGSLRSYYTIELKNVERFADGEYLYYLKNGNDDLLSEGIAMVMGDPAVWSEEEENIEYNEYGN